VSTLPACPGPGRFPALRSAVCAGGPARAHAMCEGSGGMTAVVLRVGCRRRWATRHPSLRCGRLISLHVQPQAAAAVAAAPSGCWCWIRRGARASRAGCRRMLALSPAASGRPYWSGATAADACRAGSSRISRGQTMPRPTSTPTTPPLGPRTGLDLMSLARGRAVEA
jgi:hypothetical protein